MASEHIPMERMDRSYTKHARVGDEEVPPESAFSVVEPPLDLSTITSHAHVPLTTDDTFPDGGKQAWSVIMGSFCLLMASYGLMNSVGVLQNYFADHQLSRYSASDVGWIPGLFVFLGLSMGVQVGPIFDRYGPTGVVSAGTLFYVVALVLLAECTQYWHFVLTFGILAGCSAALLATPAMGTVAHWFQRRVGLAMGIAMAGAACGGVMFPLVLRAAFTRFGYKWAIRLLALMVFVICGLGVALLRSRLPRGRSKSVINVQCFKDARFNWLTLGIFSMSSSILHCGT